MNLVRWDPFADMVQLRERVNCLLGQHLQPFCEETAGAREWVPAVDIEETPHELIVQAELAGLSPEEITIELDGETLTIHGERQCECETKEKQYLRSERTYGSFLRAFNLGVPVKRDEVTANYKDGLLTITLPKAAEAQPKQIAVHVEHAA